MRQCVLWLVAALVLGTPWAASAASINITFDLSQSWISLFGGTIVTPPDGSLISAQGAVSVAGGGIVTPSGGGAVTLQRMKMKFNVNGGPASANVQGPVTVRLANKPVGTLSAGASAIGFGGSAVFEIDAALNCSGFNCAFLGSFPISASGPQTFPTLGTLTLAGLSTLGAASFVKAISFTISGYTGVLTVVGQEISRNYAVFPEPGALLLLGPALVAGAWFRTRHRARQPSD